VATPSGTIDSVTFKIDGTNVSWEANYTTPLAPGASVTVTANGGPGGNKYWTAASGTHTVLAVSDDVNRIAETDETNNTYSETITVP
jgi:subtilase family serine protease